MLRGICPSILFFGALEDGLVARETVNRVLNNVLDVVDLELVADIRLRGDVAAFDERKLLALDEEDGLLVAGAADGGADEGDVRREVVDIAAEGHLHEASLSFGGFFLVFSDKFIQLFVEDVEIHVFF